MNSECKSFVKFIQNTKQIDSKDVLVSKVSAKFKLIQDRKVFHNDSFSVRFSYSKSKSGSFGNTILSLSALEKYDKIPFFVVLVRKEADNLIFLANTTFLRKISHSSQELSTSNIKGSFNGSDIIRYYDNLANSPENFDDLFAIHEGFEWSDNLSRLVDATSNIEAVKKKFNPSPSEQENIFNSIQRAIDFVKSDNFTILEKDLIDRCNQCKKEILIAAHIENINIRGRLIESLITAKEKERTEIIKNLRQMESSLPSYDSRNGLGDYYVEFDNGNTYTDIKTKVIYLNSNPKAYNIDKFLKQMSETKSIFMFFFIGINEKTIVKTILCSVYHNKLINNTILQFHWAGRSTRGITQFKGSAINEMLKAPTFKNIIDFEDSKEFLTRLLAR